MMSEQVGSRVDQAIDAALSEKRLVGAVVLVARCGTIVYRRSAGFADREKGQAMDESLVFRLASLTKPVVTVVAMQQVEAGSIRLEDPVTRYLPDFRPRLPDGTQPLITLEHLLTHTSGLSYRFMQESGGPYASLGISDGLDLPGFDLDENLRRLATAPLAFPPGQAFGYSLGLDVIGAVLERATGRSLPDLVSLGVSEPLGMRDTSFLAQHPDRLVRPYMDGVTEPQPMIDGSAVGTTVFAPSRALDATAYSSGGAGMVGTAGDMMAFFEAIRTGGSNILRPETLKDMKRDRVGAQAQTDGPGWGFGLGWAVLVNPQDYQSPQAPGTLQWGGAYGHHWFIDPANGLTVLVLTNTAPEGMWGQTKKDIRDAVYSDFG